MRSVDIWQLVPGDLVGATRLVVAWYVKCMSETSVGLDLRLIDESDVLMILPMLSYKLNGTIQVMRGYVSVLHPSHGIIVIAEKDSYGFELLS